MEVGRESVHINIETHGGPLGGIGQVLLQRKKTLRQGKSDGRWRALQTLAGARPAEEQLKRRPGAGKKDPKKKERGKKKGAKDPRRESRESSARDGLVASEESGASSMMSVVLSSDTSGGAQRTVALHSQS